MLLKIVFRSIDTAVHGKQLSLGYSTQRRSQTMAKSESLSKLITNQQSVIQTQKVPLMTSETGKSPKAAQRLATWGFGPDFSLESLQWKHRINEIYDCYFCSHRLEPR